VVGVLVDDLESALPSKLPEFVQLRFGMLV
jgi:hypothetical protein